ncbi:deoxyhypusine synthase [Histomonas meleagridis]|uniref:deoxyhypusine synthase n=1 Tax=Histomonas meleagridis TaxID=135588 RepID=UPI00355ABD22|nr:deoxyhypusine synthase [Histomonas meleagridis]KAH0798080.1 deoxyhypusine synthase [Histomonas meleagridis]
MSEATSAPEIATSSVFVDSEVVNSPVCKGYEFDADKDIDFDALFKSYLYTGFQATNLGLAIDQINEMLHFKFKPGEVDEKKIYGIGCPEVKTKPRECKIFMGMTSNIISCGLREIVKFIVKHKMVDVIVCSAGGIEEDLIKCLAPTHLGQFELDGANLRSRGLNRTGNLIVPNSNYCKFEDWIMPIFDKMLEEQKQGTKWTPSKMIHRLGLEINNEESVWYWAAKNDIHVYSPALTDGSIGDMLYFHSFEHPGLILDIVADIRAMNDEAVWAKKTGTIILGGGVIKHHIMNANLYRNGADFSVYINTSSEYDGSDSGARPDEAVSWGKIATTAKPVKVYAEVTLVLPIIVAQTFYKFIREK